MTFVNHCIVNILRNAGDDSELARAIDNIDEDDMSNSIMETIETEHRQVARLNILWPGPAHAENPSPAHVESPGPAHVDDDRSGPCPC